jgi:hypothetical protein
MAQPQHSGESVSMDDLDLELDDVVLFELPTHSEVDAFVKRIRPRWDGWSDAEEDVWLFTARLEEDDDLAPLLREAEQLVAELDLAAIHFFLDGRVYLLEPTRASDAARYSSSHATLT